MGQDQLRQPGPGHRQRSCERHRPFQTAEAARAHYIAQLVANETDPGQDVYPCGCGSWHHGGGIRSLARLLIESGWSDEVQA